MGPVQQQPRLILLLPLLSQEAARAGSTAKEQATAAAQQIESLTREKAQAEEAAEKQLQGVRIAARDAAEAHSKALNGAADRIGAAEAAHTAAAEDAEKLRGELDKANAFWKGDTAKLREVELELAQLRAAAVEESQAKDGREEGREQEVQELKRHPINPRKPI